MAKKKAKLPLVSFYARGNRANRAGERRKQREDAVWGTLELLGAITETDRNRLMEARRFARLCDQKELDFLCSLRQNGWKLTRTHVLQLIRVPDREDRIELARRCAKSMWSTRKLQREVDRAGRHRTYGGRKQKPPESVEEALVVTQRMAASWIRWVSVLTPTNKSRRTTRVTIDKLPKSIRTKMIRVFREAETLAADIQRMLEA